MARQATLKAVDMAAGEEGTSGGISLLTRNCFYRPSEYGYPEEESGTEPLGRCVEKKLLLNLRERGREGLGLVLFLSFFFFFFFWLVLKNPFSK